MSEGVFFPPAAGPLHGAVLCPPDKSISHRAALFGAMADGRSTIERYLLADDTLSTLAAIEALGATVTRDGERVVIDGIGLDGAAGRRATIDVGNAGTLLRLLAGWLAGQPGVEVTLDGDDSIRTRPMGRIITPLQRMGAHLIAVHNKYAPVAVSGRRLNGIDYLLPVASAQVKSCILLAGLGAHGPTYVVEEIPSRDHTERMLFEAGVPITRAGQRIGVTQVQRIAPVDRRIPGDPSSAAFMVAAALLVPGSAVDVQEVSSNWTRAGFLRIARRMGANIEGQLEAPGTSHTVPETTTTIRTRHGLLHSTSVAADEVPLAVDELPLVALLACFTAPGEQTVVTGAQELRVKETDRIAAVTEELGKLGAQIEATDDGFVVTGTGGLVGGELDSRGDHRMAMLGALAGLASRDGVLVHDMAAASVSYPTFTDDLARLAPA